MSRTALALGGLLGGLLLATAAAFAADEGGVKLTFSVAPQKYTITASGKVTDARTGEPIPHAVVRAHLFIGGVGDNARARFEKSPCQEVEADRDGTYHLTFVTPLTISGEGRGEDSLCVYASAPGYETKPTYAKRLVNKHNTDFPGMNFALGPGRLAKGRAVTEDGQPIQSALVRVLGNLNGDWNYFGSQGQTRTDENGAFEVRYDVDEVGAAGRLCISKEGYGAGVFPGVWDKEEFGNLVIIKGADLQEIPVYNMDPKKWAAATGPGIGIEKEQEVSVSGTLVPSRNSLPLLGMRIVPDNRWDEVAQADAAGRFQLPYVYPGKHELKAYPPDKSGDLELGGTQIIVAGGENLEDVRIPLEPLAEVRVLFVDAKGNPLEGIIPQASRDQSGFTTEKTYEYIAAVKGTESDSEGRAVIDLNPAKTPFVSGNDTKNRSLIAEKAENVRTQAGETAENLRVVMVPTANIRGRLVNASREPVAHKELIMYLNYACGGGWQGYGKTDSSGAFHLDGLVPGVVTLTMGTYPRDFSRHTTTPFELKPGEIKELGDIAVMRTVSAEQAYKDTVDHPEVIGSAARGFLDAIRTADYDLVLTKWKERDTNGMAWHEAWESFPSGQGYMAGSGHDEWSLWMCQNLKRDPIRSVEFGSVFKWNGKTPYKVTFKDGTTREGQFASFSPANTLAISYKLTLRGGTLMEGVLPFLFDESEQCWEPMLGLDWHSVDPPLTLPQAAEPKQE